jgi:hypothetical protein
MKLRVVGYALAAGVGVFLVATVAVSELLLSRIEFSILVGLPVGLFAGALTTALVLLQLGRGTDPTRRGLAMGAAAFGGALLGVFAVSALLLNHGLLFALGIGVGFGLVVGAGVFAQVRNEDAHVAR